MLLSELFENYSGRDVEIKGIKTSSADIEEGDLFVCIKGVSADRHDYIPQAVKMGAAALVTARDVETEVPYVKVENPNRILRELYKRFYGDPEKSLTLIGVTGTDGKTSTTSIIQQLLGSDICGYIGTNGYSCAKFTGETENTTPSVDVLYRIFREFADAGCRYVAMEASSEAFFYKRMEGFEFEVGALTNIDREHLNTHKTIENYVACKKQLFVQSNTSVLNLNDKHYDEVRSGINNVLTYGYKPEADLYIKNYEIFPDRTEIDYIFAGREYHVTSPLLASFNVENLSAAILSIIALGKTFEEAVERIQELDVDGRMQAINMGQDFYVLVDYAHTPNGLRRLFEFTNTLNIGKRIVVTGNAGERDAGKRHDVGYLCATNNDYVIFTMEDPRNEDPLHVIEDMMQDIRHLNNYETVVDRGQAIRRAIEIADKGDMIMILGKGNEDWHLVKGEYIEFNDIREARKALEEHLKIKAG